MSDIGELAVGWCSASLGDLLLDIETGKSFRCEERPPSMDEVGVVKVSAVTWGHYQEEESKTCLDADRVNPSLFVAPYDFLFSRANTIELVGACVIAGGVRKRIMLSDKILRFLFADDTFKPWVLQLLRSKAGRRQIEALATGNQESMRNIGQVRIQQIKVPVAPRHERKRIVEKLDELFSDLDAGVASLQRARANLKRYRAAVLKSAVEGRLTADWRAQHPPSETGAELLARLLRERRLRWEEAQLAKFEASGKTPPQGWREKYTEPARNDESPHCTLPQSWHWATLDVVLASGLSNGRSVPTAEVGFPVLRLTAIRGGWIDLTASKTGAWIREDAAPYLVHEGDFLISRGNGSLRLVGRGALVRDAFDEVAFPDTMIRARFGPGILPRFVRHMWESPIVRRQIEKLARTSAGIYKVAQSDLEQIAIPVPPTDEQVRIVELLDEMLVSAERSEVEIERSMIRAASLRQSILKRAFSGRLVPQDPNDEPASVLLERIRFSRASAADLSQAGARVKRQGKLAKKTAADRRNKP